MVTETDKIKLLEKKINKLESGSEAFIINEAKKIIEEEIVDEIKTRMALEGYAPGIIEDVILESISITGDELSFKIVNEHIVGSGFDIAFGRERGIKPHKIKGNPLLAFPVKASFPQFTRVTGSANVTVIVTEVQHPGLEGSFIIQNTVKEKITIVQERINAKEREWIKRL